MSISSMTNVALDRKVPKAPGGDRTLEGLDRTAAAQHGAAGEQGAVTKALDVVMAYIPTEILTLYVAVTAAMTSKTAELKQTLFYVFLVATPIVVWTIFAGKFRPIQKRLPLSPSEWPKWEMAAAAIAFIAWALALPEPPFTIDSGLASIGVLVVSVVLGLAALVFKPLPES